MLHARSLPSKLWAEAINCASYIQNRSPHKSVIGKTPFEAWSGMQPEVTHFQIFRSCAWARIPAEKRKSLERQSKECIFVGYLDGVKGYRLLDLSIETLLIDRSVCFDESPMHASQESNSHTSLLPPLTDLKDNTCNHSDMISDTFEYDLDELEHACADLDAVLDWASSDDSVSPVKNQRTRSLADIYDAPHALSAINPIMSMHAYMIQESDPQTYLEAARNPLWEAAMDEEYNSLIENHI